MTIIVIALIAAFFALYAVAVRENSKPQPKMSWKMSETPSVTPPNQ